MKNGMESRAQSAGGINQSSSSLHEGIASRVISLLRHVLMQGLNPVRDPGSWVRVTPGLLGFVVSVFVAAWYVPAQAANAPNLSWSAWMPVGSCVVGGTLITPYQGCYDMGPWVEWNDCTTHTNCPSQLGPQCRAAISGAYYTSSPYGPNHGICFPPPGYIPSQFATKNRGAPQGPQACTTQPSTPNPIVIGIGNKYLAETDYSGIGVQPLVVRRYYNSAAPAADGGAQMLIPYTYRMGTGWQIKYDQSIIFNSPLPASIATFNRPDGRIFSFTLNTSSGKWVPDADIPDSLVQLPNATGWRYATSDDEVEIYDVNGKLQSITDRAGHNQTLTYSDGTAGLNGGYVLDASGNPTNSVLPVGLPIRVAAASGRLLSFGYDISSRIVKITDPSGDSYLYAYDATGNLVTVTYPDGRAKTYLYGEAAYTSGASLPHALTGITDENGSRFATYRYDSTGRAYDEDHGGAVDHYNLAYNNGSTTVTDPLGAARTHNFTTILGVVKSTGQSQPGGSGCGPASSAATYDANGNVASRADFNGNKTCYAYDLTRNLETARVEGLASGTACPTSLATYTPVANTAQRKILTDWHPTFRLPIKTTEAGRETSTVYDSHGNVTSTSIKDTASGKTRTWSASYTYHASVPGVLVQKVEDGPRIDVSDLTTTDYYAPDASCAGGTLGCRGQVKQVTNALGHLTRITRYNAHGQPEEIIDANGLVTTLAYDARQRLTSRVVGSETTRFTYDGVGQLTRLTRADGSSLNYSYDPAHRLTQISDALGNKIVYTLDAMGNITREDIVDPLGTLVQTRRSEYDALSRLAKDIGAASQTTQYTYDAVGNPTGTTDPLAHSHTQTYDALNRLAQRVDATGATTRISRDARDNPTAVTDPRAHATQYTYDGLDNLTREISPDRGTITTTYDDAGNPLIVTDARGAKHTTSYDALNRPTQRSYTTVTGVTATPTTTWLYDQGVNGIGRLTRINDATGRPIT